MCASVYAECVCVCVCVRGVSVCVCVCVRARVWMCVCMCDDGVTGLTPQAMKTPQAERQRRKIQSDQGDGGKETNKGSRRIDDLERRSKHFRKLLFAEIRPQLIELGRWQLKRGLDPVHRKHLGPWCHCTDKY